MAGTLDPTASPATTRRVRVRVEGVVQGVGFRPFVHRLAAQLALAGFVRNDAQGVEIEAEGRAAAIDRFLHLLTTDAPPLASVEAVRTADVAAIVNPDPPDAATSAVRTASTEANGGASVVRR